MAQVVIVSANAPTFADAYQCNPADERAYIGSISEAPCELAAAAEMAGTLFSSDPIAFMPNITERLKSVAYDFFQDSVKMCLPRETVSVSYRWEADDAKVVAKSLLNASGDQTKAFARYLGSANNPSFGALALSALASTTKGGAIAASILQTLRDPKLGVSILFNMENPARAARILNLWEHRPSSRQDEITLELNRRSFAEDSDATLNRRSRIHMYQYGASVDAESFHRPLTAMHISEMLLIGFDRYEEAVQSFGQNFRQRVGSLINARKALEAHIQALVSRNIIKPCHISYGPQGMIEDMACALVPPPPEQPDKQNDTTAPEDNDVSSDLKKIDDLIDNYRYCEDMIDSIVDAVADARYQMMDYGMVNSTRDLMMNLEDIIADIEKDEKELLDKGYRLPSVSGSEELRSFLEDVENEFIDIECRAIDLENANSGDTTLNCCP